jgi:translation elongation factor EF-G
MFCTHPEVLYLFADAVPPALSIELAPASDERSMGCTLITHLTGELNGSAQVVGFIEPLPPREDGTPATGVEFENQLVGSAIPSNFIPSVEKGFREAITTGAVIGYPMEVGVQGHPSWLSLQQGT